MVTRDTTYLPGCDSKMDLSITRSTSGMVSNHCGESQLIWLTEFSELNEIHPGKTLIRCFSVYLSLALKKETLLLWYFKCTAEENICC